MGDNTGTWVSDGEAVTCMQCSAEFWLLLRRHHCRGCGQLLCYQCSSERTGLSQVVGPAGFIPGEPGATYRVCKVCAGTASSGTSTGGQGTPVDYGPRVPAKKGLPNALHVAASVGNMCKLLDAIEPLVEAAKEAGGVVPWEVDAGDKSRHTPFHLAAMGGHHDCAKALLEAGCNPNLMNEKSASGWDICALSHPDGNKTRGRQLILRMRGSVHRAVAAPTPTPPVSTAASSSEDKPAKDKASSSPKKEKRTEKTNMKDRDRHKSTGRRKGKGKADQKKHSKRSGPKQSGGSGARAPKKPGAGSSDDSSDLDEWSD